MAAPAQYTWIFPRSNTFFCTNCHLCDDCPIDLCELLLDLRRSILPDVLLAVKQLRLEARNIRRVRLVLDGEHINLD